MDTCETCKHYYAADKNEECCRLNPPQGLMQVIAAKFVGGTPTVNKMSFYPPVNKDMTCGQHDPAQSNPDD